MPFLLETYFSYDACCCINKVSYDLFGYIYTNMKCIGSSKVFDQSVARSLPFKPDSFSQERKSWEEVGTLVAHVGITRGLTFFYYDGKRAFR
jgi:hypothetical protein